MGHDRKEKIQSGAVENMIPSWPKLFLAILISTGSVFAASQDTVRDQALKALRSGDYQSAVRICLGILQANPDDEEIGFVLSRAYAFNREYARAADVLAALILRRPTNTDFLLLRARLEYWRGDLGAAEFAFNEVLGISAENAEGWAGLAQIAARKGETAAAERFFLRSLEGDPKNVEVLLGLGNLYRRRGEYDKAKASFERALLLEPSNPEVRGALTRAAGRTDAPYEVRYFHQPETFSDARGSWINRQWAFQWRPPKNGPPILFKMDQTKRAGSWDTQFGLEAYPRLWTDAYAAFDIGFSSQARHYPHSSFLLEIYQGLAASFEVSLGYRRMNFDPKPISVYFGSVGWYFGSFYSVLRLYVSPQGAERTTSWVLQVRRYFLDRNYIFAGFGQGSHAAEIRAAGDLLFRQARTYLAGCDWTLFRHVHVQFSYTRLNDRGLGRNTFLLGAGLKW
jgi:YaiO family outer membrane protein